MFLPAPTVTRGRCAGVTVSASATARMTYRFIAAANDAAKTYPGFLGGGFRGLLTIICYVCIATYTGMHALHAYACT